MKYMLVAGLTASLILALFTAVKGADWVSYGSSSYGDNYYYDRESIVRAGKGTVKVWTKTVFSDQAKREIIELSNKAGLNTEKYEDINYSLDFFVIKCRSREFRIASLTYRNSEGGTVDSYSNSSSPRTYEPIPPNSTIEGLYKAVCKRKGRR